MRKNIIALLILLLCGITYAHAQHFNDYFIDKTLRINYLHIGNKNVEQLQIDHFTLVNHWNGTRSQLVEPYHYGDILIEVLDNASQKLIYSRSYSCLFTEYRTTERGETEIARMEECVNMPMPKNPVRVRLTSFDRYRKATVLKDTVLDPDRLPLQLAKKEYAVMNLHKGNSPKKAIDILFIPDGYANIKGFSEQSGITQPQNNFYVNTLLNCTYNAIDLDRYLMCMGVWNLHEVADDAPYDAIIIICNSEKYGGGGIYNFYCTVYNHGEYPDYVVVHEMGHLIGGLADEYYTSEVSVQDFYPAGVEPTEPNLTTLVDFDSKWKDKVENGTPIPTPPVTKNHPDYNRIGVYEGGGYVAKGVYRPTLHCTMNSISYNDFCPVCRETLEKVIQYYSR